MKWIELKGDYLMKTKEFIASMQNLGFKVDGGTVEDDGLIQDWSNDVVFMNPPYGRGIKHWIKKAYEEHMKGATVVCLIPARTDTTYWHDYIFGKASDIRFLRGRLKFGDSKNSAPFPSAVIVYESEIR